MSLQITFRIDSCKYPANWYSKVESNRPFCPTFREKIYDENAPLISFLESKLKTIGDITASHRRRLDRINRAGENGDSDKEDCVDDDCDCTGGWMDYSGNFANDIQNISYFHLVSSDGKKFWPYLLECDGGLIDPTLPASDTIMPNSKVIMRPPTSQEIQATSVLSRAVWIETSAVASFEEVSVTYKEMFQGVNAGPLGEDLPDLVPDQGQHTPRTYRKILFKQIHEQKRQAEEDWIPVPDDLSLGEPMIKMRSLTEDNRILVVDPENMLDEHDEIFVSKHSDPDTVHIVDEEDCEDAEEIQTAVAVTVEEKQVAMAVYSSFQNLPEDVIYPCIINGAVISRPPPGFSKPVQTTMPMTDVFYTPNAPVEYTEILVSQEVENDFTFENGELKRMSDEARPLSRLFAIVHETQVNQQKAIAEAGDRISMSQQIKPTELPVSSNVTKMPVFPKCTDDVHDQAEECQDTTVLAESGNITEDPESYLDGIFDDQEAIFGPAQGSSMSLSDSTYSLRSSVNAYSNSDVDAPSTCPSSPCSQESGVEVKN